MTPLGLAFIVVAASTSLALARVAEHSVEARHDRSVADAVALAAIVGGEGSANEVATRNSARIVSIEWRELGGERVVDVEVAVDERRVESRAVGL
ncbi:MAG: hypothetical protein ACKOCE_02925 [Acidimicrobiia bacterium]